MAFNSAVCTIFNRRNRRSKQCTRVQRRGTQDDITQAIAWVRQIDQVAPGQVGLDNTACTICNSRLVRSGTVSLRQSDLQVAVGRDRGGKTGNLRGSGQSHPGKRRRGHHRQGHGQQKRNSRNPLLQMGQGLLIGFNPSLSFCHCSLPPVVSVLEQPE